MAVWACWRSCWHCSLSDVPRIGEARERGCPAGVGTRCQVVFLLKGVLYSHGVPSLSSLYSTMGIRQSSEQPLWDKKMLISLTGGNRKRNLAFRSQKYMRNFLLGVQRCSYSTVQPFDASELSRQPGRKHFKIKDLFSCAQKCLSSLLPFKKDKILSFSKLICSLNFT